MSLCEQNTTMDPAGQSADLRSLEVPDDNGQKRGQVHLFFSKILGEYVGIPTPSLAGAKWNPVPGRHLSELKDLPPGPKRPCRCCMLRSGIKSVDSREESFSNSKCHNDPDSRGSKDEVPSSLH